MKPSNAFMVVFLAVPLPTVVALEWGPEWAGFTLGFWIGAWVFAGWVMLAGRRWMEKG